MTYRSDEIADKHLMLDLATDAYFRDDINVDEYLAYVEFYSPDYENMFRGIAKLQWQAHLRKLPWYQRWLYRLFDKLGLGL